MLIDLSYKAIIEGILFVSEVPITVSYLADILNIDEKTISEVISMLQDDYSADNKGIVLREVGGGYQLFSAPIVEPYMDKIFSEKKTKLSSAAYETLSIIAYKQPITRSQIEYIRGVKSEGPIQQLVLRGLVEEKGRLEQLGRPILFGTTNAFLVAFGLKDISELPRFDEYKKFNFNELEATEENPSSIE